MARYGVSRLGFAASIFVIVPLLATSADAQRRAGGAGGPSGGFSRGIGAGGGISAPMIHSAAPPLGGTPNLHSFSGPGGAGSISHGYSTLRVYSMPYITSTYRHMAAPGTGGMTGSPQPNIATGTRLNGQTANDHLAVNHNLVTLQGEGRATALRNGTFASLPIRNVALRTLASTTFHGRFAALNGKIPNGGWFWRHRHPFVVIGWYGPLFWPYAYWDFVDYTFWPYAYDVFWPYAYDDLYVGVFGPYSYEGATYSKPAGRRVASNRTPAVTAAEVCREQVSALSAWPIQQIAQAVQPDPTQQVALDDLKNATSKSLGVLQSACPDDLPSTPTGRLAAMRKRIEVMSEAIAIVKPALDHFYDLLSDEQKARFNPIGPAGQSATAARVANRAPDVAQVCSGQLAKPIAVPSERLAQALNPTESQQAALRALDEATTKAAEYLKANCSADEALTPPGRLSAMEQRLNAMLEAIKIVQPALEGFYGSLTDEQKARFNQLGAPKS